MCLAAAAICILCVFSPCACAQGEPTYAIPARPLLFREPGEVPFVSLRGFDLAAGGQRLVARPITYTESTELNFRLYWTPEGSVPAGARVRLLLTGSGPFLDQSFPLTLDSATPAMTVTQDLTFKHPGKRMSGKGTLQISMLTGEGEDAGESLLYAGPVLVAPRTYHSKLDASSLREVFGPSCVPLNVSFRLGEEASVRIAVPAKIRAKCIGLGLVSATKYDARPALGQHVCRVEFHPPDGKVDAYPLRHGESTAKADHDHYRPGVIKSRKIEVFASRPAGRKSEDGRDFQVHTYAGRIFFPERACPEAITFTYLRDFGVIDAEEVVLLLTPPPGEPPQ